MDRPNSQSSQASEHSSNCSYSHTSLFPESFSELPSQPIPQPHYSTLYVTTNQNDYPYVHQGSSSQILPPIDAISLASPNKQGKHLIFNWLIRFLAPNYAYHTSASYPQMSSAQNYPPISSQSYNYCPQQSWSQNQGTSFLKNSITFIVLDSSFHQQQYQSQYYSQTNSFNQPEYLNPPSTRKTSISSRSEGSLKKTYKKRSDKESRPTKIKGTPGRPPKTDLLDLDMSKREDREKLRKRKYAKRYRDSVSFPICYLTIGFQLNQKAKTVEQELNNKNKKLERIEEFMGNLINIYGEQCRPIYDAFWNSYQRDDDDDESSGGPTPDMAYVEGPYSY